MERLVYLERRILPPHEYAIGDVGHIRLSLQYWMSGIHEDEASFSERSKLGLDVREWRGVRNESEAAEDIELCENGVRVFEQRHIAGGNVHDLFNQLLGLRRITLDWSEEFAKLPYLLNVLVLL